MSRFTIKIIHKTPTFKKYNYDKKLSKIKKINKTVQTDIWTEKQVEEKRPAKNSKT